MRPWVLTASLPLLAASAAVSAAASEPAASAQQNYVCAGVAGLASQLLESSDPASASALASRAEKLVESGVASELGRNVPQGDAVAAMVSFLQGREPVYRANPGQAVADLAACRAQGLVAPGPGITAAQVAAALGGAAASPRTTQEEFRTWLQGPWGRMKGGSFDTEMITSTTFSASGPQFTRAACPATGLDSVLDMLGHEIWFKVREDGAFGITRAAGDPGKTRTSWITLTFKDQPEADTFRYEFFNESLRDTAVVTLKRLGQNQMSYTVTVDPQWRLPATEVIYGRCRCR